MKTKKIKISLMLGVMVSMNSFAGMPVVPPPNVSSSMPAVHGNPQIPELYTREEVAEIVQKANLVGRVFSDKCDAASKKDKAVCLDDIKLLFSKKPLAFRVIRPDMAVTMDFSPSRININLNRDGAINSVQIG